MIDPDIFKANDIRGIYPDELNEEAARAIVSTAVQRFAVSQVVEGRDMRLSSPAPHAALVEGITLRPRTGRAPVGREGGTGARGPRLHE